MNTLLKQTKDGELLTWKFDDGTEKLYIKIEAAERLIKEAEDKAYKKGFTKGWNLTKGEL